MKIVLQGDFFLCVMFLFENKCYICKYKLLLYVQNEKCKAFFGVLVDCD